MTHPTPFNPDTPPHQSTHPTRRVALQSIAAGAAALTTGLHLSLPSAWAQSPARLRIGQTTAGLGNHFASAGGGPADAAQAVSTPPGAGPAPVPGGQGPRRRGGGGTPPGEDSPRNTLNFINYCRSIGAAGIQSNLSDPSDAFAERVRARSAELDMYFEGSVGLPTDDAGFERFDTQLRQLKLAGASVVRTVTLGPRRYETFDDPAAFLAFQQTAEQRLQRAAPLCAKHQIKLAVENHKDWRADELAALLTRLGSEWLGVNIDTGNNVSLLETVEETTRILAPMVFAVHFKDMDVREYPQGFLLSEVAFGTGIVNLPQIVRVIHTANPRALFSMETIVRDPLPVPVLGEKYWVTGKGMPAADLAHTLAAARARGTDASTLPSTSNLPRDQRAAYEQDIISRCMTHAWDTLGFEKQA